MISGEVGTEARGFFVCKLDSFEIYFPKILLRSSLILDSLRFSYVVHRWITRESQGIQDLGSLRISFGVYSFEKYQFTTWFSTYQYTIYSRLKSDYSFASKNAR